MSLFALLIGCIAVLILLVGFISCKSCSGCRVDDDTPVVTPAPAKPQDQQNTVRITFPEGKNVLQIAKLLEENGVCTSDEFIAAVNGNDYTIEYDFLPSAERLADRPYKLEGYLYPDTYDFYVPESADSVIHRFLSNFQLKITPEFMARVASVGDFYDQSFDFDNILTMASIVEREISDVPEEMDGVAAVFYNRMKYPGGTEDGSATGGYFQSDVTKFYPYVYGEAPDDFVSDYNTFNVKGLPKGPICCPSYQSICASLEPDHDNNNFFFYTDKNKKVYYAVTFAQHQANYQYCKDNDLVPTF